jgi:hypothetical protein
MKNKIFLDEIKDESDIEKKPIVTDKPHNILQRNHIK